MVRPDGYYWKKPKGPVVEGVKKGAHYARILHIDEEVSSAGNDILVIYIDFDDPDPQTMHFIDEYRDDIRFDRKWPKSGTIYVKLKDQDGDFTRAYKAFIFYIEKSNSMVTDWNLGPEQFYGKRIGVVYGRVFNAYQGKVTSDVHFRWFCNINDVDKIAEPADFITSSYKCLMGSGDEDKS